MTDWLHGLEYRNQAGGRIASVVRRDEDNWLVTMSEWVPDHKTWRFRGQIERGTLAAAQERAIHWCEGHAEKS
jgi:hypothetical protein